jgi:hypothetical protein
MRLFSFKLLAFLAGCMGCYYLQLHLNQSPVMASASVGFLGSHLHFPKLYEKKGLHSAIYAGSFAGMYSTKILQHPFHLILLSVIGTLLYLIMKPHFDGFGGKLGTIAFISSVVFLVMRTAW